MAKREDIDDILEGWSYEPNQVSVRLVEAEGGRELVQMRIDMGLLQLETSGRPDGVHPHGAATYLDHLISVALPEGDAFVMDEEQCEEADREFVQFYHRRICWLALRQYDKAVEDADHTLSFMDFCKKHSPDENWTLTHEQYRPFVLFHRSQAAALAALEKSGPEDAILAINDDLERFRTIYVEHEAEEKFEEDELVQRLTELRESLRNQFDVGRTLHEQLADAVAAEQYELAARLRDELASRPDDPKRSDFH